MARTRKPGARLPLSLAQEQMWALEAVVEPPGLFNITALHRFDGSVDVGALGVRWLTWWTVTRSCGRG